jgi:DNA-binding NarL/FixJ family response regulator
MNKITVLLVDDHEVLRDGLKLLLEAEDNLIVLGEAATGIGAVEKCSEMDFDVVVMDLGLPDISGFEAIQLIKKKNPKQKIVVLSMHIRKEFVVRAIECGADGYVPKSSTHESLIESIKVVHSGERYLHPKAAKVFMENYLMKETTEKMLFSELTEREQEVIRLYALGNTSKDIGEILILSPKTVDTYRHRAFGKLGISHRTELIQLAVKIGILGSFEDE